MVQPVYNLAAFVAAVGIGKSFHSAVGAKAPTQSESRFLVAISPRRVCWDRSRRRRLDCGPRNTPQPVALESASSIVPDADGHPIAWKIDDKNTGRSLDYQSSLEANGVQAGHDLYLRREPIAGGSASRTEPSFIPRNRDYPCHDNSSV